MRKHLIYMGVFFCLLLAGKKVYNTFLANRPPAEVGECLEIMTEQLGPVQLKITKNDEKLLQSEAEASFQFLNGIRIKAPVKVTFEELRESNAQKVECVE